MKPLVFETDSMGIDYASLLTDVMRYGEECAPRGKPIKEVRPLVLTLTNPYSSIVKRPGFNPALMWLEVCQLLAGRFDMSLVELLAPKAAPLMSAQGAYGPRVRDQLRYVVEELTRDPDSRRAVVYIGRDTDLRYSEHYEQPCTMTWQFFIRNGELEMLTNMRSWDLVWGLSYDLPSFAAVQLTLANVLDIPPGRYTHVAGSGHIYKEHWDAEVDQTEASMHSLYVAPDWRKHEDPNVQHWDDTVLAANEALERLRARDFTSSRKPWGEAIATWKKKLVPEVA